MIRLQRGLALVQLEDYTRAKRELAEVIPELDRDRRIEALVAQARGAVWTEDADATMARGRAVALAEGSDEPDSRRARLLRARTGCAATPAISSGHSSSGTGRYRPGRRTRGGRSWPSCTT